MKVVILHVRGKETIAVVNSLENIPNFAFDSISYDEIDQGDSTGLLSNRPELRKDLQTIFQDMARMFGITLATDNASPD